MGARLNLVNGATGSKFFKHLLGAVTAVADSPLPETTRERVAVRASQINGCGYCVDMHTKRRGGGWRERPAPQSDRGMERGHRLY
jgi:AhpD family alkylhydroperoxidase